MLEEGGKDDKTLTALGGKTMLWHQRMGHIRENGLRALQGKGMVEGMTNCTMVFFIFVNIAYMENKIE